MSLAGQTLSLPKVQPALTGDGWLQTVWLGQQARGKAGRFAQGNGVPTCDPGPWREAAEMFLFILCQ